MIDLKALRETGMPVPPISELPFIGEALPGNSHIEFKLSSSTTFDQAAQLQESEGFPAASAFFQNFNLNLNVHGDSSTLETGLGLVAQVIGEGKTEGLKAFCGLLTDASISLSFASWRELGASGQDKLKGNSGLKNFMRGEFAGILASVGDLFEQEFRVILVLNDACHVEIKVRGPGLVAWAMSCMDQ